VSVCCTKNRIQPSLPNTTDSNQTKLSDGKNLMTSVKTEDSNTPTNVISDETHQTIIEGNDIEKSEELINITNETNNTINDRNDRLKSQLSYNYGNKLKPLTNVNKTIEMEENMINPGIDLIRDIKSETIDENESVLEELENSRDEPIFKPLSSISQSGRTSRLSFVHKNESGVRSVSPDYRFSANSLFVRYNSYDKLIDNNNVRLNPLNHNLNNLNKNRNKTNLAVVSNDNINNMTNNWNQYSN
jgi:hypothetical protein